jgi:hypothetical protein
MAGHDRTVVEAVVSLRPGPWDDKLARALVAGLMLEVILDASGLSEDPQTRRRQIKSRLKGALVSHLAGRVTLDNFRALVHNLDRWFAFYFPLIAPTALQSGRPKTAAPEATGQETISPRRRALQEDLLEQWFQEHPGLLPRRRHCKLQRQGLRDYLLSTQGGWFRLKDFEGCFQIDRKTAWEYLQKLLQAGLLEHNRGRSAAVRYCLASRFLVVRAAALRQEVAGVLADLPPEVVSRVGDGLIASGGEAFWEEEWQDRLDGALRQQIITRLKAAALLEVRYQSGPSRMLRLPRHWLQPPVKGR